ncbi:MAG TPA: hypothetical protein VFU29_17970 [Chitinophagaceae bacterium]|nr:hypothetical protein [Chitinophagaceae bacterium]
MNSTTTFSSFRSLLVVSLLTIVSCQKQVSQNQQTTESEFATSVSKSPTPANPPFNLEVILRGNGGRFGHVKFRQDNDVDRIVNLGVWVRDLAPNHEYKLQRAVDAANVVDGNCTSTAWLTLGLGSTAQSIFTDENGIGNQDLWRSLSAFPSGSSFDIHFQVIDAVSSAVVLISDCYKFTIR